MKLSHSRMPFVRVYFRETQEFAHFADGERRFHAMVSRHFARS
jgi:hypothetical protein